MSFPWKKSLTWGGGILAALLIGYAIWKYETQAQADTSQAAVDQNASDNELAQSFSPQVGSGTGSITSGQTNESTTGEPVNGAAVDPAIAEIVAAIAGNGASTTSTTTPTAPVTPVAPPVSNPPVKKGGGFGSNNPQPITTPSNPEPPIGVKPSPPVATPVIPRGTGTVTSIGANTPKTVLGGNIPHRIVSSRGDN